MSLLHRLLLLSTLLAAGQLCFAQSDQSGEASTEAGQASGKQYLVELIAFQYQGPDSSAGEQFDPFLVESYLPRDPVNIDEYRRVRDAVTYTDLVHLSDALQRLRSSPQYAVMTRAAWIQPLLSRRDAVDVPVGSEDSGPAAGSGSGSPGVSGTVSVHGDHLLFVDVDIRAALPARMSGREGAGESSGDSINGASTLSRPASRGGVEVFRISERRRIKLEEVQYFDHPYIGAILSVTRHE